jgi:predicted ribosomally synthesized peptide with SipW-like signal peptide
MARLPVGHRHVGLVLGLALLGGALLSGGQGALALFTDTEQVTAMSTASGSFSATTYYLHNNPTPPTGNTVAQANLSMNTTAPTATTLFNYDTNFDSAAGRRIQRGGSGAGETTLARYQNWRGPSAGLLGQNLNGTVTVEFWSAMPDFVQGTAGQVQVFLRDVDGVTGIALEIANTTISATDWQAGSSGWVKKSASFSVNHLLLLGHRLEVKLLVGSGADDDMLFAYDTTLYRSRVRLL